MSQVLDRISPETFFPMSMGLIAITFLLNKVLAFAMRRIRVNEEASNGDK